MSSPRDPIPGRYKTDAGGAEEEALRLADELLVQLRRVQVPSAERGKWLAERLSFLLARDNYAQCLAALREGRDITAGSLARALFEEAIRWSWVDEDVESRRTAFIGAASHRYRQVQDAARRLGIEPSMFYGPLVEEVVNAADGAARFPRQIEGQLEWGSAELTEMLYTQYRLFSQYSHSSLLASGSAVEEREGELVLGRLPQPARLTVLRNAVANMAVIVDGCKAGLLDRRPGPRKPLNVEAMTFASHVAELVYPFAPATE